MGVVILQANVSVEARKAESQESDGENFDFDMSLNIMRLQKISFVSISTVSPLENSWHIFVVEVSRVRQSIGKFIKYLWEE